MNKQGDGGGTMKCAHCGVQNDSDAKFCSFCGKSLLEKEEKRSTKFREYEEVEYEVLPKDAPKNDDIVHCPRCGSTNIHFVTKTVGDDFSASQGCCGFLLFGPIGLLCGLFTDKKTNTVRKCMKCNHEF